jgi:peptidyl-dipeptidase Dcp
MFKSLFLITLFVLLFSGVNLTAKDSNPLLTKYDTPFGVPPFDKIKPEHFLPAIKEGIIKHEAEIDKILNNKKPADFKNTIEALEYSGELLNDISTVFFNLSSANTNSALQKIAKEISPLLSQHGDKINLNPALFKRVKDVYVQKTNLKLNTEQAKLLEETYKNFVRGGADLDESKKKRFSEINEKISLLTLKYGENVLTETNNFKLVIEDKNDLAGLPQSAIDEAAETANNNKAEGKWIFTVHNPSLIPFLQYASKRELREKLWRAYMSRGNANNVYDNNEIIKEIVNLRLEKANLLGYKSYAEYVLYDNMAKTPKTAYKLLNDLWTPALKVAKKEAEDLNALVKREGMNFKIEPWDWRYYAEKLRKEKYDLNEEQLRPYFKLENVRDGIFTLVNKLYGITFKENNKLPKYHPDAISYEVYDKDKSLLALIYMDFFPRESKRSGAWMTNYREVYKKDGKKVIPIISLVCNFSKPSGETPSLLTVDEVETFFHEFGHGLHGMFAKGNYKSISGTNVSRDFVELPSQIMENWSTEPEVLALYAKHWKTNTIIPAELVQKLKNSGLFNQGFITVEYLAASLLDLSYYSKTEKLSESPNQFETAEMNKIGLISEIIPRYKSAYFQHVFSGGYSAGYYSYIWAAVLDADAFEAFKENGLFDKKTAEAFRTNVLENGNKEDAMTLYKRFRGKEPIIEPLLKRRGLK